MENHALTDNATKTNFTRRSLLIGLTAAVATPSIASAALRPKAGPTLRRFWMSSIHTGDQIDTTYFKNGRYDKKALRDIRSFLRDWRTGEQYDMDLRAIDIWADTHRALGSDHPFQLISGYRSPKTNNMLRSNSSGVARKSFHMRGMAADLRLRDRSLQQIARAASNSGAGGIGLYPGSDFVHVDTGPVRRWQG
jgi:uncharacterized protein YcbK (DUF882 family)